MCVTDHPHQRIILCLIQHGKNELIYLFSNFFCHPFRYSGDSDQLQNYIKLQMLLAQGHVKAQILLVFVVYRLYHSFQPGNMAQGIMFFSPTAPCMNFEFLTQTSKIG